MTRAELLKFSPWYLKASKGIGQKIGAAGERLAGRVRGTARNYAAYAKKKSVFSREGYKAHKKAWRSGKKVGRVLAVPAMAGAGYLGYKALYDKPKRETLNYCMGIGDLHKMEDVRRLVKRYDAARLAARRDIEKSLFSRKAIKTIAGKIRGTKAVQHITRHKGKYGIGAGAFVMGRATKPKRKDTWKEKQTIYRPYKVKKSFSHLQKEKAATTLQKIERARRIIKEVTKDDNQMLVRKKKKFGEFVNMVGKVQAERLLK